MVLQSMSAKTMDRINGMEQTDAVAAFKACCGSTKYTEVCLYLSRYFTLPPFLCTARGRLEAQLTRKLGCAPCLMRTSVSRLQGMVAAMPFQSAEDLKSKSDSVWATCGRQVRFACRLAVWICWPVCLLCVCVFVNWRQRVDHTVRLSSCV